MAGSMYSKPIILRDGKAAIHLDRIDFNANGAERYNEEYIQRLAFENPSCLPIGDIDRAYEGLVPIGMEFDTPAGPVDVLYVTPTGRLVIVEAKLWRNPEARRKVVAQILDYAKEFSRWDYEDLQREVSRHLGIKGNVLYDLIAKRYPDIEEARFVDEVYRSLKRGRFLLLILGDGIREGAGAIAEFLERVGNLEFTFGLVEMALYKHPDIGTLIQPRVIARSIEFKRTIIELPDGIQMRDPEDIAREQELPKKEFDPFYRSFWREVIDELKLDDPSQPLPNLPNSSSLYLPMPPPGGVAWVGAGIAKSAGYINVLLSFVQGTFSDKAAEAFQVDREDIERELGNPPGLIWYAQDGRFRIIVRHEIPDVTSAESRELIKKYFLDYINRFVNVFRPRLERLAEEG